MIFIIILVLVVLLVKFVLKPYIAPKDTVELWVGTNGSGKSLNGVKSALNSLKRNTLKVKWYNFWHRRHKKPLPVLISNIPIYKGKRIISYQLKPEHLLGVERLPEKCVVLIDEVSLWLSQMDYKNPNVNSCDDMATLYRHYTQGGYLVLTTQDISKCCFPYRYCTGSAFVLSDFKKHWWGLFKVASSSVRRISINGDIQAIEIGQKEDNEDRIYRSLFSKHYDTYAYSERYKNVPEIALEKHTSVKVIKVLRCPKKKIDNYIED